MLTGAFFAPAIPDAGNPVTATVSGAPDAFVRWYLTLAPTNSALIDRSLDAVTLIKTGADSRGTVKVDVAGQYQVEVRDVREIYPLPTYGGEIVPPPSHDDTTLWFVTNLYRVDQRVRTSSGRTWRCLVEHVNQPPPSATYWREEGLPYDPSVTYAAGDRVTYVSGSLDATYEAIVDNVGIAPGNVTTWRVFAVRVVLVVAQKGTRQIGEAPASATLSVRLISDQVVDTINDPKAVTLEPSLNSLAKIAAFDPSVQRVLAAYRATTSQLYSSSAGALPGGGANDYLLPGHWATILRFNAHLGLASTKSVHGAADSTNTVSGTSVFTLAGAVARINAIAAALTAHAALGASTHIAASVPIVPATLTDPGDLEAACLAYQALWVALGEHASDPNVHGPLEAMGSRLADGAAYEWQEAPKTLDALFPRVGALTAAYNTHRTKLTNAAAHAIADTQNLLVGTKFSTVAGTIATINQWADRLEAHGFNKNPDSTAASTPFHTKVDPNTKVGFRASDLATAVRLAETLNRAYTLHALNTDAHGDAAAGAYGAGALTLSVRLTKAWLDATTRPGPTVPERMNYAAVKLAALGWSF